MVVDTCSWDLPGLKAGVRLGWVANSALHKGPHLDAWQGLVFLPLLT